MSAKSNRDKSEVFREELKEHRGTYYVTYQPADSRFEFACVDLVFHDRKPELDEIRRLMERELVHWLNRFPVPIMVSSFDATEELIHLSEVQGGSHLTGHIDPVTGETIKRWGIVEKTEMTFPQITGEHLGRIYHDLPFQLRKDVRAGVDREYRKLRTGIRIFRTIIVFIAAIPVAIELVSLGLSWLGNVLQAVSILTGLYKVGKTAGWLKSAKPDEKDEEKRRKMDHYYYHCERNPAAFQRLRSENFHRECAERTHKEAAAIAAKTNAKLLTV